jgi:NAD(P)H dehydrogenase (quinone)
MNILIVHAHPEPKSFTSALCRTAEEVLVGAGHGVEVTDLYRQQFNPVASAEDFYAPQNVEYLVYALEQGHGIETGTLSSDILREMGKVQRCDLLLLTFPVFWFSVPAILKGWMDRVFNSEPFHDGPEGDPTRYTQRKKAMVCATFASQAADTRDPTTPNAIEWMMAPLLQGALKHAGFDVLEPFFADRIPFLSEKERADCLLQWRSVLQGLECRAPHSPPARTRR